ncbi:HNH endonuclease [Geodermatophilus sp. SYSU D00691]
MHAPAPGPQTGLADGPLGDAQRADREIARWTARRARALAAYADSMPATADRVQGEPGAMSRDRWARRPEVLRPVSEWAAQEASIGLTRSQQSAEKLIEQGCTLQLRLPGTLAALEAGLLTPDHLWPLLQHVAPVADDRLRGEIEDELLGWVAERAVRRTITTPPQLRDRALREVKRRDARSGAQRAEAAARRHGVHRQCGRDDDGSAWLAVGGTRAEIETLFAALGACADALPGDPDDTRARPRKMFDCLLDRVLRPGESELPPVQVVLTVVAQLQTLLGGDQPGEVNGQVASAEEIRQLLIALTGSELGAAALAELQPATVTDRVDEQFLDDPGWEPWEYTPEMRAALAEWEDGWDRRCAAGEFDDPDPAPAPARPVTLDDFDPEFDRLMRDLDDRWWAELEARLASDPDVGDEPVPDEPATSSPGDRWWADADRAVDDASVAVLAATRAIGHAARVVATAERADAADEAARRAGPAGRVDAAADALAALRAAADMDREALADLLHRSADGGLAERPRIALVDALTGAFVGLTDLPGLRRLAHCGRPACRRRPDRCDHDLTDRPGLGPPLPTDGYRPGAELDRYVRHRDRRCRFPGCRRPVRSGELDHHVPYPLGPTSADNLAGYCTGDHRLKHQAPGFTHDLAADGTVTVTTPSGLTATTQPPPF